MATACAAVGGMRCAASATESAAKGEPFPLVMLKGCQADLSAAAQSGPEAIDAAKERAMACMETAVREAQRMPTQELVTGQDTLRKRPEFKGHSDAQVADSFRASLSAMETECGRIAAKFTRYNCFSRRLAALAPPSKKPSP